MKKQVNEESYMSCGLLLSCSLEGVKAMACWHPSAVGTDSLQHSWLSVVLMVSANQQHAVHTAVVDARTIIYETKSEEGAEEGGRAKGVAKKGLVRTALA